MPIASNLVSQDVLSDQRDWEALLARHVPDFRDALAAHDVLRLRLVSQSLRRAFSHQVDVLQVPWPPLLLPPPAPRPPCAPATAASAAAAAVRLTSLERPGGVFPHANQLHLHLDILALATVPYLPAALTPAAPCGPVVAAAGSSAAAARGGTACARLRVPATGEDILLPQAWAVRPASCGGLPMTADDAAGGPVSVPPGGPDEGAVASAAEVLAAAGTVSAVADQSQRQSTGGAGDDVSDPALGGVHDRGAGGSGVGGGRVGASGSRALGGVRLTARLPLRLQFGGRVMSAEEQRRLEARVSQLTKQVLAPRRRRIEPDPNPDPKGRKTTASSLKHAARGGDTSAQSTDYDGATGGDLRPHPWVAPWALPPGLTRLHLELEGPPGGSSEEELRCLTPAPAALTEALMRLPQLRELGLSWWRIQGGHLAAVVAMKGLRSLSLVDHYEGPDGWLGACRAAVPLAHSHPPPSPRETSGRAVSPSLGVDAPTGAWSGAVPPTHPPQHRAPTAIAAAAAAAAASSFAAAFGLPPLELLPAGWSPGLLAAPTWLSAVQQLRLLSPSIAAHGQPPWLIGLVAPPPPSPQLPLLEPPPSLSQPRPPTALLPSSPPPLSSLTHLEVGGGLGPRRRRHRQPLVGASWLPYSLADLAQDAAAAAAAAPAATTAAAAGAAAAAATSALPDRGRLSLISTSADSSCCDGTMAHGSEGLPPPRLQPLAPPPGRPSWVSLAALSFQAQSLGAPEWAALCALSGLRELRINGWRLGAAVSSALVLEEVDGEDLTEEAEGAHEPAVNQQQQQQEEEEEEDGLAERERQRGMRLGLGGEGAACEGIPRTSAGRSGSGGGSLCGPRGDEAERGGGGGEEGWLSLPRLRLLMLSLRRGAQLRRVVGNLPLLETLHLAIRGGEGTCETLQGRQQQQEAPREQQPGDDREKEQQPGDDREKEQQRGGDRRGLGAGGVESAVEGDKGEPPEEAAAAAAAAGAAAAASSAWRPLLRCSRLVEVNISVGSTGGELPLTDSLVGGELAAAWPRLAALQYSAGGWAGLGRTSMVALGGTALRRHAAVAAQATATSTAAAAAASTTATVEPIHLDATTITTAVSSSSSSSSSSSNGWCKSTKPPATTSAPASDVSGETTTAVAPCGARPPGGPYGGAPPAALRPLPGTGLQVLSLGSSQPHGMNVWVAPEPLYLEDLPPGLRVLSVMGLQLRRSGGRLGGEAEAAAEAAVASLRRQEAAQRRQSGRGEETGGGAECGGAADDPGGPLLLRQLLPASLSLLSVKSCCWQVAGVSLLQAVSCCPGLLDLRLAWAVDDPPYMVRQHAADGGGHQAPGPGPRSSSCIAASEEQQWAHLAAALPSLERLELTCWPPAGRDCQSGGAGQQMGEAGASDEVPNGSTRQPRKHDQHQQQDPQRQPWPLEGEEEGHEEEGEAEVPPQPNGRGEAAAEDLAQDRGAFRAAAAATEASLSSLLCGLAYLGGLQSLQLSAPGLGGWGDQVDWSALSRMTGLVKLALYGVSRGSAARVLQMVRSTLPLCRPLLHVDNTADLLEQLRHTDMLLRVISGAGRSSSGSSSSGSSMSYGSASLAASSPGSASVTSRGAAGVCDQGSRASEGSAVEGDVEGGAAGELEGVGEEADEELLEELMALELLIEAEAGAAPGQPG